MTTNHPVWVKTCQHPGCVITADHTHGTAGADRCSWCNRPGADTDLGGQPIHAGCITEAEGADAPDFPANI